MIIFFTRTVFLYFCLIVLVRPMGKRQLGQLEPTEFVVTMLVADLAAIPMQDGGIPVLSGLIPILTVLGLELVLSGLSLKSVRVRKLLCGSPVILIENVRILQKNLKLTRITLDELMGQLREKDVLNPETVQYAILETNGSLSVFPYPGELPAKARDAGIPTQEQLMPVTIVSDGKLLSENLLRAKKDRAWLSRVLHKNNCTLEGVWLLTVDSQGHTVLIQKET